MIIPVDLSKDRQIHRKTKQKTEEESKNAYEKSRGEFPILKFQTDRNKDSENKIGKSFKKKS